MNKKCFVHSFATKMSEAIHIEARSKYGNDIRIVRSRNKNIYAQSKLIYKTGNALFSLKPLAYDFDCLCTQKQAFKVSEANNYRENHMFYESIRTSAVNALTSQMFAIR